MKLMPGKFTKTDFLSAEVELWNPDYAECGRGFQCKRSEFGTYWFKRLATDVAGHVNRVLIIRDKDNLAAYITISASSLEFKKVKGFRKRPLEREGIDYTSLPAIKIGRLAADGDAKKSGTRLLLWTLAYIAREIAPLVGVRFVTLEALYDPEDIDAITGKPYDVSEFYRRFGFQYIDPDENLTAKTPYRSMFLDLKPMIELAQNPSSIDSTSNAQ
jgi:hypothetical protein